MRIGCGYDVHAFCEGDQITLGALNIPFNRAFSAHSDGDVLIHAMCDALFGALSLGDIGQHFPPSDPQWENCQSSVFLRYAHQLITEKGYQICNIDNTIICEQPKIAPHIKTMQHNIATILNVTTDQISIKATTTEKLGFCGRQEGIAVQSVCLLSISSNF